MVSKMTYRALKVTMIAAMLSFISSSFVSCNESSSEKSKPLMQDGRWEGTGEGRNGMIMVNSTVENNRIVEIRIVSQSESPFAQESINTVIRNALSKQDILTIEADGVSGATLTSTGTIDAINMSIRNSRGEEVGSPEIYHDAICDVAVIGAGGAGLCASIEASSKGMDVIILEKMGIVGGNTNYSTGGINAAETSFQQALGIVDSKDLFYNDTWIGGHELGEPELIRSLVENAPQTMEWLSGLGADMSDVGILGGSSVRRTHRPQFGAAIGPHLIKTLYRAALNNGVEIRTRNEVKNLIYEGGKVCGVVVENHDGSLYRINAKAVIMATGGFGGNLEMVEKYRADLEGFATVNHRGATGDAFEWTTSVGGALTQMDMIQIHPTAEAESHILISEAVRGNGGILINRSAERFINELQTRDVVSAAIMSQTGESAFLIFDKEERHSLASIDTYIQQGVVCEEQTLSALANEIGVESKALEETVRRYNEYQSNGIDEDFGRPAESMRTPVASPPFYAIEVKPAIHHTMGGVSVNADMEVLTIDKNVIPGLFAAGEVTGGLHGGNRLGGNGVADIVVNGKIAGSSAAEYVTAADNL